MLSLLVLAPLVAGAPAHPSPARSQAAHAAAIDARLARLVAETKVPGVSVGIVTADGASVHCAGFADREAEREMTPEDLLCAGSTGKTFVAAVVLQLVAEEKIALDALAGEYLGDEEWFERLPNAGELTIENLLSHRSGLPRYVFRPEFSQDLVADPDRAWTPVDDLAYVFDQPPTHAADEAFSYSDTGFLVLGLVVEKVTGASLYDEVQRRLLDPLELHHVRPQTGRTIPGLAQGYAGQNDPLGLPDLMLDAEGRFCINPAFEYAGGGFASSGGDLARWIHALHLGDVVTPDLRERMGTGRPAPELGRGVGYGFGTIVWPTPHGEARGHEGFFPGYLSVARTWPEHELSVAVQVNTSDFRAVGMPLGRLCDELAGIVLAARSR
jgi:D-alanyl-D-alanine carboxypeptidase